MAILLLGPVTIWWYLVICCRHGSEKKDFYWLNFHKMRHSVNCEYALLKVKENSIHQVKRDTKIGWWIRIVYVDA